MINLLFLKREAEKSAPVNVLKAGAGILSEAVDLDSLRLGSESSSANALPRWPLRSGSSGAFVVEDQSAGLIIPLIIGRALRTHTSRAWRPLVPFDDV